MKEQFSVEEINLMNLFDTSGREKLMSEITDALGGFNDEMLDVASAVIYKLSEMSDADYSALELYSENSNKLSFIVLGGTTIENP